MRWRALESVILSALVGVACGAVPTMVAILEVGDRCLPTEALDRGSRDGELTAAADNVTPAAIRTEAATLELTLQDLTIVGFA